MNWNKTLSILLLVIFWVVAGNEQALSGPPSVGGVLPEFYLPVPKDNRLRQYLGLDEKPEFMISEIKADVIIIQIFSMY